jgi:hypothetical protein
VIGRGIGGGGGGGRRVRRRIPVVLLGIAEPDGEEGEWALHSARDRDLAKKRARMKVAGKSEALRRNLGSGMVGGD